MKAMKVTMKAMKLRVSRPELHKALIKDIKFTLLKTNTECKARKAQSLATKIFGALRLNEPRRAINFRSVLEVLDVGVCQSVKNNSVNEKWHRKRVRLIWLNGKCVRNAVTLSNEFNDE